MKANLTQNELAALCRTVRELREATLAIALPLPERSLGSIRQAFDSAASDLCRVLSRHNPKFNASRFLAECGHTVAARESAQAATEKALRRYSERD